ncbi:MAG: tRNA (guanosine(46)-N7)-methyltransferase TrmB [Gammaproteobacteria bacterium]|nr:tRNA (guanosine(46)-N7)-methyltransferase TrmB [Gammaproteobacteria bacterium]
MIQGNKEVEHLRTIKSFVIRSGRMTLGQEKAFQDLWVLYGVEADEQLIDFNKLFSRPAQVILEIGFGMGDSLLEIAKHHPENNYLGIEVHKPGVGRLLANIHEHSLTNIKLMKFDAVEVLKKQIKDNSLSAVYLFFPDPWHKTRHQKRRIVKDEFIQLIRQKLVMNGHFHIATDWEHYARQILKSMQYASGFINCANPNDDYIPRPDYRPKTKFERRGERLGHDVWDILFQKNNDIS